MKSKNTILILVGMFVVLLLSGVSAAMTSHEQDIYNSITNPFTKLIYAFQKGFFFFTSWGQENGCSENPDWDGWIKGSASWSSLPSSVSCSKVGAEKCAIDIWYDNIIYASKSGGPPSSVNWNNWLKEVHGTGVSFSGSSYPYYYVEVYSCPVTPPPVEEHSTKAYTCQAGTWDYKGRYDNNEYCSYDTSGEKRCWCSDEDDNFYVDSSGGVHCRESTYSSVNNGAWCPAQITVYRLSNNQCNQISISPSQRSSFDYDTLSQCQAQITGDGDGTGDGTGDGGTTSEEIDVTVTNIQLPQKTTSANIYTPDRQYPFKATIKNNQNKAIDVRVEAGFYTQSYAKNIAKLYSIFPLFATSNPEPIASCVPTEPFVKTVEVTLAPGETKTVEIDVAPINGYITLQQGKYNLGDISLVSFLGVMKHTGENACCKKLAGFEGCAEGTGGYVGGGLAWQSFTLKPTPLQTVKNPIMCSGEKYGEIDWNLINPTTISVTDDYRKCVSYTFYQVNGTVDVNATEEFKQNVTTLFDAKKIALTKDEIKKATSPVLLASSCLFPNECVTDENHTASCTSIASLRDDGVLTEPQSKDFFDNAKTITQYGAVGAAGGIAACVIGSVIAGSAAAAATALTAGTAAPIVIPAALTISAPLLTGCAAAGALFGGFASSIVLDITQDDQLLKELKAENANAVGICVKESKGIGLDGIFGWAAWFDVDGNGTKNGVDGLIIVAIMSLFAILLLRK